MEKTRVLIVDDDASLTRTLKLYLEGTGSYEVLAVNRGTEALAAAREFRPDIVLLDIVMPDRDGATVAAEMKADSAVASVPIVFLTALVSTKEVGPDGKTIGGHPFLAKPVDPEKVIQCIEQNLGGGGDEGADRGEGAR